MACATVAELMPNKALGRSGSRWSSPGDVWFHSGNVQYSPAKASSPQCAAARRETGSLPPSPSPSEEYSQSVVTEQIKNLICHLLQEYGTLQNSMDRLFFPDTLYSLGLNDFPMWSSISHHTSVAVRKGWCSQASQSAQVTMATGYTNPLISNTSQ